ncbi:DUF4349 domain-containing protein [Microbacterium halotolerans]|uniref:DUF4349 domain-containing protein n=1 Tax=Microbacterium halotolerans TaxID=246613 RepID=UPI000E6AC98A|nr:DUF4349 domain-containing protein [Microbacterium halotolerans]
MNVTEQHTDEAPDLPELSEDAVDRIEAGVFSDIARGREDDRRRARRRRGWIGGSVGVAAALVVGAVVAPAVMSGIGLTNGAADSASTEAGEPGGGESHEVAPEEPIASDDAIESSGSAVVEENSDGSGATEEDRLVIRNGSAVLVVDDVLDASDALTALAAEHDGYVEEIGSSSDEYRYDAETGEEVAATGVRTGWVSLRIPADQLDEVRQALSDVGEVTSTQISESDVTGQAIDLEARIDTAKSSVERLTELMEQAGSVSDLLDAETVLTERQAQLESYQRELEHLEDRVAMSSLHVELTRDREVAETDPAGFGDGLVSGWNGLIGFFNGLVIAIGFMLPWLGVIAVAGLVVWIIIRIVRRRSA